MSQFLLEIYSEEIPARMQSRGSSDFKRIFAEFLQREGFFELEESLKCFIGPRRITLLIENIDEFQTQEASQKIGPPIDANEKAIAGFAKSVGIIDIKDLKIIDNKKGKYYAFDASSKKISTKSILENNLCQILQKMSNVWPKNMRWHESEKSKTNVVRWVRPIRSILAIFDGEVVNFEFAKIKSSNTTFGHNLISNKSIVVNSFKEYEESLKKNSVTLNQAQRKEFIISEIQKICAEYKVDTIDKLDDSNQVLNEAIGLTEFPQVGIGKIDDNFMDLPKEVLILTAKLHQKYFCLQDRDGKLASYFIFVSNVKITDKIIVDNQKVLRARLSDAKFFIDEDLKIPFASRVELLKNIVFHERLGSLYDKIKRLETLNKFIALWIPNTNLVLSERLADLSKNDLTTKCVAELPELQGIVGGYYTKMQGDDPSLSKAIAEQYLPVGPSSPVPETPLGSLISLSDKIDTICGLFLVGQKPTSSKDPLALRRAALGIVRIIIHHNVSLPLRIVVEKSINAFPNKILKENYLNKTSKELKEIRKDALYEVIEFIIERMKSILKDYFNIRADIANTLIDGYFEKIKTDRKFDINKLVKKAKFINEFVASESNSNVISLYKRVVNIVKIEEKKDNKKYDSKPHPLTMRDKFEKDLYKKTKSISLKVRKSGRVGDYREVFEYFQELENPLDDFFENVKVNVDEKHVRENRLLILGKIKILFNDIFDFSKIEK